MRASSYEFLFKTRIERKSGPRVPGSLVARSSELEAPYGFCVGRSRISLANDCGACVTIMATA